MPIIVDAIQAPVKANESAVWRPNEEAKWWGSVLKAEQCRLCELFPELHSKTNKIWSNVCVKLCAYAQTTHCKACVAAFNGWLLWVNSCPKTVCGSEPTVTVQSLCSD